MVRVIVRDAEPIESALKRFKRKCKIEGIVRECFRRTFFTKPSDERRRRNHQRKKSIVNRRKKIAHQATARKRRIIQI